MIYLDNNATTAIDPLVQKEVLDLLNHFFGNPSSIHQYGQEAKKRLLKERGEVASFFGVKPEEVFFTSGATEGLNMVLRGIMSDCKGGHLITSSLEHEACFQTAKFLEGNGIEVSYLFPEKGRGAIQPSQVADACRKNTRLIALMWANNETGAITCIEEIAEIASKADIPLLVDGVAFIGKEKCSLPPGVSAVCLSGHKIHALAGIGVTIVRKHSSLLPIITGGPQQLGKRGGTENLPGIVAISKALELIRKGEDHDFEKIRYLRDQFEQRLLASLPNVHCNFQGKRVSNTSNLSFLGISGETLLIALDQAKVAVSHGAACSSGALEPSRVLLNMGISREVANSAIRFSFSRMSSEEEVIEASSIIIGLVKQFIY